MSKASLHIEIDRSKPLTKEPSKGHNRWSPDIDPVISVDPGEIIAMETRDAFDLQFDERTSAGDVGKCNLNVVHPLTGPVYVNGAKPGDLLEVNVIEIRPESFGFTVQVPGFGFLRDIFTKPHILHWRLENGFATSEDLPGVKVPGSPFMGVMGLAPSHELLSAINGREAELVARGGMALGPEVSDAIPQGDNESCGTAIEMGATFYGSFKILKGFARKHNIRDVQYYRDDYFSPPDMAVPKRFFATTGQCYTRDGQAHAEDATIAARNALLNMIDHLVDERGFTPEQAYAICSVAVDLRISEMVDVPNFVVSALLPLDIFS